MRTFLINGLVICLGLSISLPTYSQSYSAPESPQTWTPFIDEAANRFGVPRDWIVGVMTLESGGRTAWKGRPITSSAGAMGLMQLLPGTYAEMRADYGLGADPYDPHDNILAGTAYLKTMYDRYGYPGLFAAYNAGPGRYEASLKGAPLPLETRLYLTHFGPESKPPTVSTALFFQLNSDVKTPQSNRLFVPLSSRGAPGN